MKTAHLKLPVSPGDLEGLEVGTAVWLDGTVFTAREGVYQRALAEGVPLPDGLTELTNANFHCSPAASRSADGSYHVGAVTATASFRFSKWLEPWFAMTGTRIMIGKGGMSPEDYRQHFVPNKAIYLTTVGYGTGALLGRGIKRVRDVHWMKELGIAQAIWVFEVEKFGPFLVDSDLAGNSLFEQQNAKINEGVARLYEGLKPPALKRYGETVSKTDEVV
jgi:L(+)-tartrate dehydratase beta subunit